MKKLVWLLVIVNVGLLAYFNLDYILPATPTVKFTELNPEKISLLSQKQIDALPKKTTSVAEPKVAEPIIAAAVTAVATAPSSCYEWGVFSAPSVASAQTAASKLSLQATVKEQTSQQAKRFWVYRPPLKTAQEAQAKAAELKSLGVQDMFVVQEPKWRNAISFGVFEDEQLAIKLMNELKSKGVKDVVKALRNQGKGHFSLMFNNLTEAKVAEIKLLKSEFPEAVLKESTCN